MNLSILVVGQARAGKSCYIGRVVTGQFCPRVSGTCDLHTNIGTISLSFSESLVPSEGYDGYIFMYDHARPETSDMVLRASSCTVVVASKCDGRVTAPDHPSGIPSFSVSAKWNKNLTDPILHIVRSHLGNVYLTDTTISPPLVRLPRTTISQIVRSLF